MKLMLIEEDVAPELIEAGEVMLAIFDEAARRELTKRPGGFILGQRYVVEDAGKQSIVWDVERR